MVLITITYDVPNTTPPVFVAGSFTDWIPVELERGSAAEDTSLELKYSKTFDVPVGQHQYKFRLGPGDWWVCDIGKPTENDSNGNTNNVLTAQVNHERQISTQITTDGAYDSDDEPSAATIKELRGSTEDFEADAITRRAMRNAEELPYARQQKSKTAEESKSRGDIGEKLSTDAGLAATTKQSKPSEQEKPVEKIKDAHSISNLDGSTEGTDPHATPSPLGNGHLIKPTVKDSSITKVEKIESKDCTTSSKEEELNVSATQGSAAIGKPLNPEAQDGKTQTSWFASLFLGDAQSNAMLFAVVLTPLLISWIMYR